MKLIGEDRVFESETDLLAALEKAGVGDLRVVLADGGKLRLGNVSTFINLHAQKR